MTPEEVVRAWKIPEHRDTDVVGYHPAGEITLDGAGGSDPFGTFTVFCCTVDAYWCPPPQSPLCLPVPL
jgi:hypothetical protein